MSYVRKPTIALGLDMRWSRLALIPAATASSEPALAAAPDTSITNM